MVLAARGLREEDDGKTRARIAGEWLVAVKRQAARVWLQSALATAIATAAALVWAFLR